MKDIQFFQKQEKIYCPENKKYYTNPGLKSREQWYEWRKHIEKGATYNMTIEDEGAKNMKRGKPSGSSGEPNNDNKDKKGKYKKDFVPPRFDIEDLFPFNYEDMFNSKPNTKWDKIYKLNFNHEYYKPDQIDLYDYFIDLYHDWKEDGRLDKLNIISQKLSTYISKNHINSKNFVDGSIICNIGLIVSNWIKTGQINIDIEYYNQMTIEELNEETNRFCLFILCQLFTTFPWYKHKYINGKPNKNWWVINLVRHRETDKDFKSKGVLPQLLKNDDNTTSFILY